MSPSRILIFGASGFIGGHLCEHLESTGWAVGRVARSKTTGPHAFQGSANDTDFVKKVFSEFKPNFVVNLISLPKPGREPKDFALQIENDLMPAINIAQFCPADIELALFFGSCEEYGNLQPPFLEDGPTKIFSPYGWSKVSARSAVEWICNERSLNFAWLRPFLTFGPRQSTQLLVPTLIQSCLTNSALQLTPGEQTRDFIFVRDVCKMVETILLNPVKARHQTLNLCSGTPRKVKDVAHQIQSLCQGGNLKFGDLPYRTNEAMSFYGSTEKYQRLFGLAPTTDFSLALSETVDWYRLINKP